MSANRRILLTSTGVTIGIIFLKILGILQPLELITLDGFFRASPNPGTDRRIVIVGVNEKDIQKFGTQMSDAVLAELLQKIYAQKPRVIGLDIYRSRPIPPGSIELERTFVQIPNLIAIEKIPYKNDEVGIAAPATLKQKKQVGFNNVVIDIDGKVRRSLLYWHFEGKAHRSFALQIALMYLKAEGITPQAAQTNSDYLQLGQTVFRQFKSNDGGYVGADSGGYQILGNFRGPAGSFRTLSVSDVLAGHFNAGVLRDSIVLIGSTAPSMKDLFSTPYSAPQRVFGVEVHANFTSQILSAVLDNRPLIQVLPDKIEWLWIFVWSSLGAAISWKFRSPGRSALGVFLAGSMLTAVCYLAFLFGWWWGLFPPLLGLMISAVYITGYFAYLEEEFKKSREFLYSVINTIPDPIFVKDQKHRWIVLNQAYCKLIGYGYDKLIEKSEQDFFGSEEALWFRQQDEQVFHTGVEQESEEKFTDAKGNTYLIATKRSLHKDAAGNLFLVGVIRDITERKKIEEELKRTASELARSNQELKTSKDQFRYLAYHDPLTGLPNRKLFQERLSQSLDWAVVNNQKVALLFLDLDGFKQVNDTHGHDIGDLLLKAVASRLTRCLRGSDTVCRLGGDEFTVILTAIPGIPDAVRVAQKILKTLAEPFLLQDHSISVTSSIGISLYPLHSHDVETLINQADTAMYAAKEAGKNRYEIAAE
ncbi:CHASE2 domain-containing protein [Ancylothrix sp. C2]|uniref:CHASE2 domain-containing protein n=1 Tax=Ancylothrix sp. D3o TaxID=2953691 RepID=UPI0021BB3D88|nr:CHASE2 domain-containing protein [Ancylothrix sp. D3o]MCT7952032.1 CHASE2 domain-containing protein [Ancylothrix sp. D3o]